MSRLLTPKNKLARREGVDLSLKTFGSKAQASLLRRLSVIPGKKHTARRGSKLSDYGKQLREKQKLKRIYHLNEAVMRKYFGKAIKIRGNTADHLVKSIETRLDNVVYRLHFAPTRASARQLVTHGHIKINGAKVNIPSYPVSKGNQIEFANEKSSSIPYIKETLEEKNLQLPKWLKRTQNKGEVVADINPEEYAEPVNMALVVEFYSKL